MARKFKISVNGKDYDVEVVEVSENQPEIKRPEPAVAKKIEEPVIQQKAKEAVTASQSEGSMKVNSPMPGTILKINVEVGQKVKKGEVILILEAMKMENEVTAPNDGIIASINVSKGSRVNVGELMVSMEGNK